MKKTLLILFSTFLPLLSFQVAEASENTTNTTVLIEVLERDDCEHCLDQKEFLEDYKKDNQVEINYYDIAEEKNRELFNQIAELEGLSKSTPITIIGDEIIQGFDTAETTGRLIDELVSNYPESIGFKEIIKKGGSGEVNTIENSTCSEDSESCLVETDNTPSYVKIPFVGVVDAKTLSLPSMALILGFIDGFNPCAMWVLVTFLLVLLQIGDRRKMFKIAGIFILAETIMYYLILNVWSTVWDFVGLDKIITPIVGLIAIGGGIFFLYEWKTSDGTCKVTNSKQRLKTRSKIKAIANADLTPLTVIGIIGLALSVNVIEFACSIGIPQTFTKILDLNLLSILEEQFLMLLYILMYMVDDFIVFGIAFYSIEKIGMTTKYSKACNLIGGLLMILLGFILIINPNILVF